MSPRPQFDLDTPDPARFASSDYQFLREYLSSLDTPRPFRQRVQMWLRGTPWRKTKWRYKTLHGLSSSVYPNWSEPGP